MTEKHERPDWLEYFFRFAELASTRSSCLSRQVGAVIVKDKQIMATGYNGAPTNTPHCGERGCLRKEMDVPSGERHELCWGVHAEQNAIIQAAKHGVKIEGSDLFCTVSPCAICMKMIVNAGIENIFFAGTYPDKLSMEIATNAGYKMGDIGKYRVLRKKKS